jgi:phage/plasmid-associated DNA primase
MLYFKGEPRSGKGNYMRLLMWVLGNDNIASKNLNQFGGKNALGNLPGKLLCCFSDERGTQYANETALMNILKISGQDPVPCEDKWKRESTEWLTLKFAIFTNGKLFIEDEQRAGLSRILAIQSRVSHKGKEDTKLELKIQEQKNEVLSWMLRGLWLLQDEGFIQPENELIDEYKIINSPISTFLEERCEIGGECCKQRILTAYKEWMEQHNSTPSVQKFYEYMSQFNGSRRASGNVYEGISLREGN